MPKTIYVSIGNTDDKLRQAEWAAFVSTVNAVVSGFHLYGEWYSRPDSWVQNACWCLELPDESQSLQETILRAALVDIARSYRQDSIAWAEAQVEFLSPSD